MELTYHFVPYTYPQDVHFAPLTITVFEGNVYTNLNAWAKDSIRSTLELMDETFTEASLEAQAIELMGDYFQVRAPFSSVLTVSAVVGNLLDVFSEDALEKYLDYEDGIFTLFIEGDAFLTYVEPALAFLLFYGALEAPNVFLHHNVPRQSDTMGLMEWFLDENADFVGLNLLGHDVSGSALLENRIMPISQGVSISVPVFAGNFLEALDVGLVLQETESTQLLYMAVPFDGSLVVAIAEFAELFMDTGNFTASPLRVSEAGDIAMLALEDTLEVVLLKTVQLFYYFSIFQISIIP